MAKYTKDLKALAPVARNLIDALKAEEKTRDRWQELIPAATDFDKRLSVFQGQYDKLPASVKDEFATVRKALATFILGKGDPRSGMIALSNTLNQFVSVAEAKKH